MSLRVLHLVIQPVIVDDDGVEFTPGPQVQPVTLPPSQVASFIAALPSELARLEVAATSQAECDDESVGD